MKNKRSITLLIVLVMLLQLALLPVYADDTSYYKIIGPKTFRLKNSFELMNTGSNPAASIKAVVLVGAISDSPYQRNINYKVTPAPKYTYVDSAGNIYAEIYFQEIKAQKSETITIEKEIINSGISYSKEIYTMEADYSEFGKGINNLQYYESGDKIETEASQIKEKISEFALNQSAAKLAKDIYNYVNLYITYDTNPAYANKGALSAIKTARGVCDEYATLFAALSRVVGIPARVATGYWLDKPLKQEAWNDISSYAHAWPEFYLPKVGWIPAEPTFFLTVDGVRKPDSAHFANFASDDIHLLNGYQSKDIKSDISVSYSYYKPTNVSISIAEQSVMPIASLSEEDAFMDVEGSWARDYINKLYNEGILFGKQDDLYKPGDNITRAEFSAYLVNTLKLESSSKGINFKDVNNKSDYAAFIKTASAYGLIRGNPQGYFKPNDTITREDAAVIMQRAIELLDLGYNAQSELQFVDRDKISPYAKDSVELIYDMEIMAGKPGNIFDPKSFTTRAEASKLLDNFKNAIE